MSGKTKIVKQKVTKSIKVYVLKVNGQPVKSYDEDEPDMTTKFNALKNTYASQAATHGSDCDMKIEVREGVRESMEDVEVEDNEVGVEEIALPS